jgi:photosystem II stability/assembly factor-like uncharacterized protein
VEDCLNGICFRDENLGWVVGQNGTILCTEDGGTTWTPQQCSSDRSLNAFCSANSQKCYAVGDNGTQMLTTDGGTSWETGSGGFYSPARLEFAGFFDDLHGWACQAGGEIAMTSDGGMTWTVNGSCPWGSDVTFSDPQNGWCITGNIIFHSEDGGVIWDTIYGEEEENYRSIFFASPDRGWIGGNTSYSGDVEPYLILRTTNGGETWTRKLIPRNLMQYSSELVDLYFSDESNGRAVGMTFGIDNNFEMYFKAEILRTNNGGASWAVMPTDDIHPFYVLMGAEIFFIDYTIFLFQDNSKEIYKSSSNGAAWTRLDPGDIFIDDVYFSTSEEGWLVGSGVSKTVDGGLSWALQESPTAYDLHRIVFTENGDGWIFGENSTILHLADTTTVAVKEPGMQEDCSISVYPNPTSGSSRFTVPSSRLEHITVKIYDLQGREVATVLDRVMPAGEHTVMFDAGQLPPGVYLYRLETAGQLDNWTVGQSGG